MNNTDLLQLDSRNSNICTYEERMEIKHSVSNGLKNHCNFHSYQYSNCYFEIIMFLFYISCLFIYYSNSRVLELYSVLFFIFNIYDL